MVMDTKEQDPHAPRSIRDMVGFTHWEKLQHILKRVDPPHIVVVGGIGTGKSRALQLILGSSILLWIQCTQDPTLRDNRERIKQVARRRAERGVIQWIILEHADMLHSDAQAFLRRVIETNIGNTRFLFEVRDSSVMTEPLLSRTILFTGPSFLPYEIRAEIMRRAPSFPRDIAERIAEQSDGNIRWAVLQGLGNGAGMIDPLLLEERKNPIRTWTDILHRMERIKSTGTNPRAWVHDKSSVWDRPGGACPWALTALTMLHSMNTTKQEEKEKEKEVHASK
jgi:hypothetical protein